MGEPLKLKDFIGAQAKSSKDDFLKQFPGAFLLGRFKSTTPVLLFLPREDTLRVTVGADEDCDLSFELDQTLDPVHVVVAYHQGFRGWTITEETRTNFGTMIDGERLAAGRPLLLRDRQEVKLGGGLSELQFYTAESLWQRMSKAGITRSLPKRKPSAQQPAPRPEAKKADLRSESHEELDSEDLGV